MNRTHAHDELKRSVLRGPRLTAAFGATALMLAAMMPTSPAESAAGAEPDLPETLELTAIIRDFRGHDEADGHPDFQAYAGTTRVGLVESELDANGKPVLKSLNGRKIVSEYTDSAGRPINPAMFDEAAGDMEGELEDRDDARITSESSFASWYRDAPGVNLSRAITLTMHRQGDTNVYVFDSDTDDLYEERGGFFPINDQLFGNYSNTSKNFHFTTELETEFVFERGEGQVFKFTGDDDVWVFIDGKLVIDMGSLHSKKEQHLELDRLDWLNDGDVYSLKVFHAERRTSQSNFRMETTLRLSSASMPSVTAAFD